MGDTAAAKVQLGRLLFFDTSLSEPAGQSCATCHAPGAAITDPEYGTAWQQDADR